MIYKYINYSSISIQLLLFLVLIRYGSSKLQIMDGLILPFTFHFIAWHFLNPGVLEQQQNRL